MCQAFGRRGDMDSLAKLADVLPVNAMDWPLSGDEKKKQLLRLYNEDVKTADSMLSSGEKALEALRDELDAVRKAAGVGKPVLTDAMLEKLSPRCGAHPPDVDAEVERLFTKLKRLWPGLRAAVESAAAVLRAICPTKDDPDDSELEDAGGRRRARSEGACRDSDAPPIRSAMCQTPRQGRRRRKVPEGYDVQHVFRNENPRLWRKYAVKKSMMKIQHGESETPVEPYETKTSIDWTETDDGEPVDSEINEWHLWHGTSQEGAQAICKIDFKVRLAGTATGTLYGRGTYFAESITKADEYAKEGEADPELGLEAGLYCVLLCRIIGGQVLYTDEPTPDAEKLQHDCLFGDYDVVVGDREKCRGTFKEFVIFSGDQAYPEYVMYYTRR